MPSKKNVRKKVAKKAVKKSVRAFTGRNTAGGVSYESSIAAYLATKMLAGSVSQVWENLSGEEITAITLQTRDNVDDITLCLQGDEDECVFISAKERASAIPFTDSSKAFIDTIKDFVEQYLKTTGDVREKSRLIWAVNSSAGMKATKHLPEVLDVHRDDAGDTSLTKFLQNRARNQEDAFKAFYEKAKGCWKQATSKTPTHVELRKFMRHVYVEVYDFGIGYHDERNALDTIRTHLAVDKKDANNIWKLLCQHFAEVDSKGTRQSSQTIRRALADANLQLQAPPDYSKDIEMLRSLTQQNIKRLKEHTVLQFGMKKKDCLHIPRKSVLSALYKAVKGKHRLITGEPGCGKSGVFHDLARKLQKDGVPVVLLLAEEVFGPNHSGPVNLPGLQHDLDEALANWPTGKSGFFLTDALDAVRAPYIQKLLRQLIDKIKTGKSGWNVIASVREFELKFSKELRDSFPGTGTENFQSKDFSGVSHFYIQSLSDEDLEYLIKKRSDVAAFIKGADQQPKSSNMHRSPFFLKLAAELLRDGFKPAQLADWNSPAMLLRKYWQHRVLEIEKADECKAALKVICSEMLKSQSMLLSSTELNLSTDENIGIKELQRLGILRTPSLLYGTWVREDQLWFNHDIIHDYAIARTSIPSLPDKFAAFATENSLRPVFYRQSFIFALEEIWLSAQAVGFWDCALKLESKSQLHGITRIIAPALAARRIDSFGDLEPLLIKVKQSSDGNASACKALAHLVAGLQDMDHALIRTNSNAWCAFSRALASLLNQNAAVESPLVQILDKLNTTDACNTDEATLAANIAARELLAFHIQKPIERSWRAAARIATECLCRTFSIAPKESEASLLTLLDPERLKHFLHNDLFDFAHSIEHLGAEADYVVLALFEAAFSSEPETGKWEEFGTRIMPMRMQSSDQWHSIQYSLVNYYTTRDGTNPVLMTDIVCLVWNQTVRRRESCVSSLGTIKVQGISCKLWEDYGHIWGTEFENDANTMLNHYVRVLREWSEKDDLTQLKVAVERFLKLCKSSVLWSFFLRKGSEYPDTLGLLLEDALESAIILTNPNYTYGSTALLGTLHKQGIKAKRRQLEKRVLELPRKAKLQKGEKRKPVPSWLQYAQNRLLCALEKENIVLAEARILWEQREKDNELVENRKPERSKASFREITEEENLAHKGIQLRDPINTKLNGLKNELKFFSRQDNEPPDITHVESNWGLIGRCERAIQRYKKEQPEMVEELWGYLAMACEALAEHARWPKQSARWKTIRRILLKASTDTKPTAKDEANTKEDSWPSWGVPSPRIDAAQGLPSLTRSLGKVDSEVKNALRRLAKDKSHPVRFNLASKLVNLYNIDTPLMWELVDTFIKHERRFSVLEMVGDSLDSVLEKESEKTMPRLRKIANKAKRSAPNDNKIHESLARIYLFRYLRTDDSECKKYIRSLIDKIDEPSANSALLPQLHICRKGGWMTAGDTIKNDERTDSVRTRTWSFLSKLLSTAQSQLKRHRDDWAKLYEVDNHESEEANTIQEKMKHALQAIDGVVTQLFFASGAYDDKQSNKPKLSKRQTVRFWLETKPLFESISNEPHPSIVYHLVETLTYLLPQAPCDVFMIASNAIITGSEGGFQYESLVVKEVVNLIQRALADHKEIFQSQSGNDNECIESLLRVLDIFVEAGWQEARQLTYRLEEIYR